MLIGKRLQGNGKGYRSDMEITLRGDRADCLGRLRCAERTGLEGEV